MNISDDFGYDFADIGVYNFVIVPAEYSAHLVIARKNVAEIFIVSGAFDDAGL